MPCRDRVFPSSNNRLDNASSRTANGSSFFLGQELTMIAACFWTPLKPRLGQTPCVKGYAMQWQLQGWDYWLHRTQSFERSLEGQVNCQNL